ncbi:MAG: hypothetical protein Q9215_002159 [Flavoplaca cf. flavocitrina]
MAIILHKRSDFVDDVSAKASSGWDTCMGKPMCKWPAILGILLAVLLLLTCTYFLLRCLSCCCCDCLSGGRYQRNRKHKYVDLHSSPYNHNANTAYQPPTAPPGYPAGQAPPPQYAQFERPRGDDSSPAMPSWKGAQEKTVNEHGYEGLRKDAGMGSSPEREKEYEQRQPMLATGQKRAEPVPGYVEMDGNQAGDLGGQGGGYRPYGQAYAAYLPGGPGSGSWRNV